MNGRCAVSWVVGGVVGLGVVARLWGADLPLEEWPRLRIVSRTAQRIEFQIDVHREFHSAVGTCDCVRIRECQRGLLSVRGEVHCDEADAGTVPGVVLFFNPQDPLFIPVPCE